MVTKVHNPSTEFMEQIIETVPDGSRIKLCLQCGACSGACPFGFAMEHPPHSIIAAMRAGSIEEVLADDSAWMCISCYACTQVCPAQIPVTKGLTTRIKEELVFGGNVPPEFQDAVKTSGCEDRPRVMDLNQPVHEALLHGCFWSIPTKKEWYL